MKKFLLLIILIFLIPAAKTFAASIYFSSPEQVKTGEIFDVKIIADTGGEAINSVDLIVGYDKDLLSFSGYKNSGMLVRLWIKPPYAEGEEVNLSGIIPGGASVLYDPNKTELGNEIPLAHLLFKAERSGLAAFSFKQSSLLKNDGLGSFLTHTEKNSGITIIESETSGSAVADQNPPGPFEIIFTESFVSAGTPDMIMFEALDAESGIKNYQIKKDRSMEWKSAISPVPVSKGIFPYIVTVRAVDFSGNFRDETLEIPGLLSSKLWIMLFVLLIFGIIYYKLLSYKK